MAATSPSTATTSRSAPARWTRPTAASSRTSSTWPASKGMPVIGMNDSAGAYVPAGVGGLDGYAEAFTALRKISGVVPSIMCMFGFNAGGGAYLPRQGSFVIQPDDTFFGLTGPGVVKSRARRGRHPRRARRPEGPRRERRRRPHRPRRGRRAAHRAAAARATSRLQQPRSRPSRPPAIRSTRPRPRSTRCCARPSTRRPASTRRVDVASSSSRSATTATTSSCSPRARRTPSPPSGASAATSWASSPTTARSPSGQIDIDAAYKNARFIRFCNLYNVPIVFIEDTTGFLPGKEQEAAASCRPAARCSTPSSTCAPRASCSSCATPSAAPTRPSTTTRPGADLVIALPTTRLAVMGPAGKEFVYKDDLRKMRAEAAKLGGDEGRQGRAERPPQWREARARAPPATSASS